MSTKLPRLAHLRQFAGVLGWDSLTKRTHRIAESERRQADLDLPHAVVWYEAGDFGDLWLQINVLPALCVAVYAPRFRLCSLWHRFELGDSAAARRAEAERLDDWVHRRWFARAEARRKYRRRHRECCGFSARRIRERVVPRFGP